MKQINLDREAEGIKQFFRSLPVDADGSILVLEGQPVLKVIPIPPKPVDKAKLRAAILKRRDEMRELHQEWEAVDREMWEKLPEAEE